MKTYKEFIAEVSGASIGASIRPGQGFSVGAGIDGGNKTRQYKAGVRYDQNKVSGQGDKTREAISKAIENPGTPVSTSSAPTTKRSLSVGGSLQMRSEPNPQPGGGNNPKPKPKDRVKQAQARKERHQQKDADRERRRQRRIEKDPEPDFKDTVEYRQRRQQNRLSVLQRKNKFKTKYRYAVPTGTGGRWNTNQASGANQMTDWKAVKTNRTGGKNYERTKVVGDPLGSGGTGRTVGAKRYDKLFGKGGRYEPAGDGSTKYVNPRIGKPFNPKGYQPNKFVP